MFKTEDGRSCGFFVFFLEHLAGFPRGAEDDDAGKLFGFKAHCFTPIGMKWFPCDIKKFAFVAISSGVDCHGVTLKIKKATSKLPVALNMVPKGRFELPRVSPHAPQACVSTYSTTSAYILYLLC